MEALWERDGEVVDAEAGEADVAVDAANADDTELLLDAALLVNPAADELDGRVWERLDLPGRATRTLNRPEHLADEEEVLISSAGVS